MDPISAAADPLNPDQLAALDAQVAEDLGPDGRPLPGPHESLDLLAGGWRIFQLVAGHRFSTDDLLTAWLSARVAPEAKALLDIGAGIGSVGLLALHRRPADARLTMVEAQRISHRLAKKTVAYNGLGDRVSARHGDLRDPASLPAHEEGSYAAVTGSPPYIPLGKGHVSPHPQRAACRMELRGDVADYAATAARALAPDGTFVFCHAAGDPRPEAAIAQAGLRLLARQDVFFRQRLPPTIALFRCGWQGEREDPAPFVIRDANGDWTEAYLTLRSQMGGPPNLQRET